jgi:hypothetical protein
VVHNTWKSLSGVAVFTHTFDCVKNPNHSTTFHGVVPFHHTIATFPHIPHAHHSLHHCISTPHPKVAHGHHCCPAIDNMFPCQLGFCLNIIQRDMLSSAINVIDQLIHNHLKFAGS